MRDLDVSTFSSYQLGMYFRVLADMERPGGEVFLQTHRRYAYWTQFRGSIMMYPRQAGKTYFLNSVSDYLGPQRFNYVNFHTRPDINAIRGIDYPDRVLLLDEFTFINQPYLQELVDRDWRHVIMLGTYT